MDNFKLYDNFWRVGSVEITEDYDSLVEAKKALDNHLQKSPSGYHWMAFGYLDRDSDFIISEQTLVEIN